MAVGEAISSFPVKDVQVTAAVFVMTLVAVKLVSTMVSRKRYKLPPGPWGLPIVGYLPFFGKKPFVTFTKMRKTYGDVISITMGSWPAIVISGPDVIKEALVNKGDDFAGRPAFTTARMHSKGKTFSFAAFGPIWKMHRKIVSNVMYMFTNARNNPIEDIIRSEANIVIGEFLAHGDSSFCPTLSLEVAGASMIFQLCYGRHQDVREDAQFIELVNNSWEFQEFTRAGNPVDVMPWLRFIMPGKVNKFLDRLKANAACRMRKVEEHEASYDDSHLRDITDGLIHAGNTLSPEERAMGLDKGRLMTSLGNIYGAASTTVPTVLQWGVCLMAAYPEIQDKVFQQIDNIVGQARDVTLADRTNLPLVEATISEILRFSAANPFALPHATTRDTTLQGYDIPEGTVVIVNLYSICFDEDLWGDPQNFRPERFLTSKGEFDRGLAEQVSSFSLGLRRCVGESLARMEIFLFFATLMQRLKFCKPPGHPGYTFDAKFGLKRVLKPFDVCVSQRQ